MTAGAENFFKNSDIDLIENKKKQNRISYHNHDQDTLLSAENGPVEQIIFIDILSLIIKFSSYYINGGELYRPLSILFSSGVYHTEIVWLQDRRI